MSPKPRNLSDNEEEAPVEDGYLPFERLLDLVQNVNDIPESRLYPDEDDQQLLYFPIMYPVNTYREEIERIENDHNFCAWSKTKNIVIVLVIFGYHYDWSLECAARNILQEWERLRPRSCTCPENCPLSRAFRN